jgi:hypothetical protein
LKGILITSHIFHIAGAFILFKIGLFSWIAETHICLGRKSKMEACTCSPYGNWVGFWKEQCLFLQTFKGRSIYFFPKGLLSWMEETGESLGRKPPMLEGRMSGMLFPNGNWLSF